MDHAPKLRDKGTKVTNLEGAAAAVAIVEVTISSIGSSGSISKVFTWPQYTVLITLAQWHR